MLLFDSDRDNFTQYVETASFYSLVAGGKYLSYLAVKIFCRGLAAGAWALAGLWLSTIWRNRYVAMFSPMIIVYFKDYVYAWFGFHPRVYLKSMELADLYVGGVWKLLAIIVSSFLLVSACFTALTYFSVRRRLCDV